MYIYEVFRGIIAPAATAFRNLPTTPGLEIKCLIIYMFIKT